MRSHIVVAGLILAAVGMVGMRSLAGPPPGAPAHPIFGKSPEMYTYTVTDGFHDIGNHGSNGGTALTVLGLGFPPRVLVHLAAARPNTDGTQTDFWSATSDAAGRVAFHLHVRDIPPAIGLTVNNSLTLTILYAYSGKSFCFPGRQCPGNGVAASTMFVREYSATEKVPPSV